MPTTSDHSVSTRFLIFSVWRYLTLRRQMQIGFLLVLMLLSGVSELVSLGAVLPFLSVLTDPDKLWRQPIIQSLVSGSALTSSSDLVMPVTFLFASSAVLAALIRLTNLWLIGRLCAAIGSDLSCEAYRRTLYQPYSVHVQRNSATVITGTINQIPRTVQAITFFLEMITASVVAIALLLGIVVINWTVAVGASLLFGVVMFLALSAHKELKKNSQLIVDAATRQIKALQEGMRALNVLGM